MEENIRPGSWIFIRARIFLFVQGWINNFPKMIVGIWQAQVQKLENVDGFALLDFFSALPLAAKKTKKSSCYFPTIFNRFKFQSRHATKLFPHSYTLRPSFWRQVTPRRLLGTPSLFGATNSTLDPDLEEAQHQILLSAFSSLKVPDPSLLWELYQSPSINSHATAVLTIAIFESDDLLL